MGAVALVLAIVALLIVVLIRKKTAEAVWGVGVVLGVLLGIIVGKAVMDARVEPGALALAAPAEPMLEGPHVDPTGQTDLPTSEPEPPPVPTPEPEPVAEPVPAPEPEPVAEPEPAPAAEPVPPPPPTVPTAPTADSEPLWIRDAGLDEIIGGREHVRHVGVSPVAKDRLLKGFAAP